MKTSLFLCLSAFLAMPTICRAESSTLPSQKESRYSAFEQALQQESEGTIIRAQSPGPVLLPPIDSTTVFQQPPYDSNAPLYDPNVGGGGAYDPAYPAPVPYDPWSGGGGVNPLPNGGMPAPFGLNGPQPYRFNSWTERLDVFYMSSAVTSTPSASEFGMSGIDFNKDFPIPVAGNWIFTPSMDYGARFLSGPLGGPTNSHLPGNMHRFGLGLKLATPMTYGWGFEASIEPWLATDFDSTPTSDAFMVDAHAAALWQWSPQMMWILGISYWDRVDGIVLPYGGLVWTPNEFWEFRLVFPKPRVTAFIGAPLGVPTWAYASAEYHVEAFEVNSLAAGQSSRVQFSDWRAMGGLRWETPRITSFIEAGYVFDRQVKFGQYGGNFDIDPGFITRVGLRF